MSQRQHAQIFVSYSRSDRIAVDSIVRDLRQRDFLLWMDVDERGIEVGEDWQRELVEQMSAAEAVLACISPDFLRSPYCRDEIEQAQREGKPIFPVLVRRLDAGQSTADMGLDKLQYVDFTQDYDGSLKQLVNKLPAPKLRPRNTARRIAIVGGIVAALVGLVGLVVFGSAAGFSSLQPTATAPPPTEIPSVDGFNLGVAVSRFNSDEAALDTATRLSEQFTNQLRAELGESLTIGESLSLSVGILGPDQTLAVTGPRFSLLQGMALVNADIHGAELLVYGDLTDAAPRWELQAGFSVSPEEFVDALEVAGNFDLGGPLRFLQDSPDDVAVQNALRDRTLVLSRIVLGLAAYNNGENEQARAAFADALSLAQARGVGGEDVLYVLLGNAHARLASEALGRCDSEQASTELDNAFAAYEAADAVDPETPFARSLTGRASASYLQAQATYMTPVAVSEFAPDGCERPLDETQVPRGLDYVAQARAAAQPDSPVIRARLDFAEAQLRFFDFLTQVGYDDEGFANPQDADFERLAAADAAAQAVIDLYNNDPESRDALAVTMVQALLLQADGALFAGDWDRAGDQIDTALAIVGVPPRYRIDIYGKQGDLLLFSGRIEGALDAYETALQLAEAIENQPLIVTYTAFVAEAEAALRG